MSDKQEHRRILKGFIFALVWMAVSDARVERHISQSVGRLGHQRCTNHGTPGIVAANGALQCFDTFTDKLTGARCKPNPAGRGFVCFERQL
jgi:hypothetical protein